MTLFDDNPTILEESQLCMHVDHEENILCDSYIVEFEYEPTCNYYERGKYGCGNFDITELLLVMLRIFYMITILLNLLMILHVIIMREENMVVEIFMLLNYLSLC